MARRTSPPRHPAPLAPPPITFEPRAPTAPLNAERKATSAFRSSSARTERFGTAATAEQSELSPLTPSDFKRSSVPPVMRSAALTNQRLREKPDVLWRAMPSKFSQLLPSMARNRGHGGSHA